MQGDRCIQSFFLTIWKKVLGILLLFFILSLFPIFVTILRCFFSLFIVFLISSWTRHVVVINFSMWAEANTNDKSISGTSISDDIDARVSTAKSYLSLATKILLPFLDLQPEEKLLKDRFKLASILRWSSEGFTLHAPSFICPLPGAWRCGNKNCRPLFHLTQSFRPKVPWCVVVLMWMERFFTTWSSHLCQKYPFFCLQRVCMRGRERERLGRSMLWEQIQWQKVSGNTHKTCER